MDDEENPPLEFKSGKDIHRFKHHGSLASLGSISLNSFQSESQIGILPEIIHVKKKLGRLAMNFDPQRSGVLRGFDGTSLGPTEFKEQMRRNFGMNLTPSELGAMITWFDKDGDGTVDCGEFLSEFFKLGRELRRKEKLHLDKRHAFLQQQREERQQKNIAKRTALIKTKVDYDFSEKDRERALKKVSNVASFFDRNKNQVALRAFIEGGSMDPTTFKQILWRSLGIKVSPAELGALMKEFDNDGDGSVDADEFIFKFFQIGRQERQNALRHKMKNDETISMKNKKFDQDLIEKYSKMVETKPKEYSETDLEKAISKVAHVARLYDRERGFNLMSFMGVMDLTKFKEQLKVLGIRLNRAELTALMNEFDADGDNTVDCSEFLSMFFRIGRAEKTKYIEKQREENVRRKEEAIKRKADQVERFAKMKEAKVVWPRPMTHPTAYFSKSLKESQFLSIKDPVAFARSLEEPLPVSTPAVDEGEADEGFEEASWGNLSRNSDNLPILKRVTQGTTEFLRELEKEEIRIQKMKLKPIKKKKKKKNKKHSSTSSNYYEDGNHESMAFNENLANQEVH
mmetsp:Transcript_35368/g.45400  ORF Transcript_35368/g.45400 Transcript_35368/m.45400 type:complete len:571 (+) Transcript_35368:131-1843(+)|eukprot:CAMPEP_0117873280 /NCGR_PEP_ID=MMETSP0950-20121206/11625_1 /TAXON_ID=44440 /ORGANISM="Chattonella subsalsa, Strain CCMP2191" /LENGTH=570 /DNA_ID=CAMNT_0005726295 /DNA_START=47 /DNA_END=1759 /DNA_ORIENTATION=-